MQCRSEECCIFGGIREWLCLILIAFFLPLRAQGLYACSAGCHPAGSVIGCAGHNAAAALINDLGMAQWWRLPAVR